MSEGFQFKIIGRYVYAPVESAQLYNARTEALAKLREWKQDARKQGLEFQGRIAVVSKKEEAA